MAEKDFSSKNLPAHILRGVIGFGSLIGSIALLPAVGAWSLLLAPVGVLALRGCPMCWMVGLMQTLSRGKLKRECTEDGCKLVRAEDEHVHNGPYRTWDDSRAQELQDALGTAGRR